MGDRRPRFPRGSAVEGLDAMLAEYVLDIESSARGARDVIQVLLIAPREPTQSTLADMLESAGYIVSLANGVADAERVLARFPIDVVVTEDTLPDGSGHELRAVLAGTHPRTVVLVMSDDPLLTQTWVPYDLATVGVLEKPVRGLVLLAAIRTAIQGRHP